MHISRSAQIESILFYKTEPVSYAWLARMLDSTEEEIIENVQELKNILSTGTRGLVVVEHDGRVMLATHPEMGGFLEQMHKKDMHTELSRAALEALTIILYKQGVTKADLDYIRGVNSQFMLRNLLVRGLIEKKDNPDDKRRSLYIPSHDTLRYLGIQDITELPQQSVLLEKIEALLRDQQSDAPDTESEASEE